MSYEIDEFEKHEKLLSIMKKIRSGISLSTTEIDTLVETLQELKRCKMRYAELQGMIDRLWADKQELSLTD